LGSPPARRTRTANLHQTFITSTAQVMTSISYIGITLLSGRTTPMLLRSQATTRVFDRWIEV
jgi:hypothetical protein